jgi:hypothetical protein
MLTLPKEKCWKINAGSRDPGGGAIKEPETAQATIAEAIRGDSSPHTPKSECLENLSDETISGNDAVIYKNSYQRALMGIMRVILQ